MSLNIERMVCMGIDSIMFIAINLALLLAILLVIYKVAEAIENFVNRNKVIDKYKDENPYELKIRK